MGLRDVVVNFETRSRDGKTPKVRTQIPPRVTVLTDSGCLRTQIHQALLCLNASLDYACSIDEAKRRLQTGSADVGIVDLQRDDAWPGIVFHIFDEIADRTPLILLCNSPEEARHYVEQSEHVVDVLPKEAVLDERFQYLVHAAMLRYEYKSRCQLAGQ